jgi:photosystem II stability/assembly factor-like uncharacterized protein
MIRLPIIAFLIVFLDICFPHNVYSTWNQVGQFSDGVGCGYFFDADNGMIGIGKFGTFGRHFVSNSPLAIYWTSNGGKTWIKANTPTGGTGRITSIHMMNRSEGYAAVYSNEYSLWKTTDGGKSWFDRTQGNYDLLTCVYATSKAIIRTTWGSSLGGSSTDGGNRYSSIFDGGIQESNGIDFTDDNTGVATMGPGQLTRTTSWFTRDGGITWNQGNDLPESWSVYGVKGSKMFFTCSEDEGSLVPPGHTIYWSQDGGNNWQERFSNFPFFSGFTGHIAGAGNTLYVQTSTSSKQGLFRSDDLGSSWINVGGPSNTRDSRFAVTGCRGEVVYAFDDNGGVWKTIDGGDGAFGFTPRVGNIKSVKAGDTTRIPIYIDSTTSPFTISQFSGSLALNTDLLSPFAFDTAATLSQSVYFDTLYVDADKHMHFLIKLNTPLKNGILFSQPLIYIKAAAYVTKSDTTNVILSSLDINTGSAQRTLTVCSSSSNIFTLANECGDSTLRGYMATGKTPQLFSISPNPSKPGIIEAGIYLPKRSNISLEIFNTQGLTLGHKGYGLLSEGKQNLLINTAGLSAGEYILRIQTDNGSYLTGHVVITR